MQDLPGLIVIGRFGHMIS